MNEAVIVSGARTPIGGFGGAFKNFSSADLGAHVISAALERTNLEKNSVDQVIMGCSVGVTHEINIARRCALKAGLQISVPAYTVNQICASGLRAILSGIMTVETGQADVVVAGGTENMSQMPYILRNARWGSRLEKGILEDSMTDGPLSCPFNRYHMGITGENVQKKYNISRGDQDAFAFESHRKAVKAIEAGRFTEEIAPVTIGHSAKGTPEVIETDQHPRSDLTLEKLSRLSPYFKDDGTITVGTASGLNDGAGAVVIMSREKAEKADIASRLQMVSQASVGVEPELMGMGPVPAVEKALELANLKIDDIDLIEINEAFAVTSLAAGRELKMDWEKVNVNGGAIALGHPIGATAAVLTIKLMYEMQRRNARYGLVTACVGGGQGIAAIFENLQ